MVIVEAAPPVARVEYEEEGSHESPQLESDSLDLDEHEQEYRDAKVAAVEAVSIGRQVATEVTRQSEILARADMIADQNRYIVEKSNRILRGMTWHGWVYNKLTRDVKAPSGVSGSVGKLRLGEEEKKAIEKKKKAKKKEKMEKQKQQTSSTRSLCSVDLYNKRVEECPSQAERAVRAVKNYHCNILLLKQCNSGEQRSACLDVCNHLRATANETVQALEWLREMDNELDAVHGWLSDNMFELDQMHKLHEEGDPENQATQQDDTVNIFGPEFRNENSGSNEPSCSSMTVFDASITGTLNGYSSEERSELFGQNNVEDNDENSAEKTSRSSAAAVEERMAAQEAHLEALTPSLDELQHLGKGIGQTLHDHNEVLFTLNEKSEELTDRTKEVIRRAARITQRSRLKAVTPRKEYKITIQHSETGRFLTVVGDGLQLTAEKQHDASTFNLWTREGSLTGLQNCLTDRWIGQSLLGSIVCFSPTFGSREMWEIDVDCHNETRLLCASANWGAGGWINVRGKDGKLLAGGCDYDTKKSAALWQLTRVSEDGY